MKSKNNNINKTKLVSHIKRLQGQLNSVANELLKSDTDCVRSSNTLYAATRSFASLKQDFVKCFLEQELLVYKQSKSNLTKVDALLNLVKG